MQGKKTLSTGIDLIEIQRFNDSINRHGKRFLNRIFTTKEIAEAGQNISSLAVRFAAKEAVAKALGTGIGPIGWKEIEVIRDAARRPTLHLHGNAKKLSDELNLAHWSISLSHSQTHAIAMVTAISDDG